MISLYHIIQKGKRAKGQKGEKGKRGKVNFACVLIDC